jgi:hypothetical protein
MPPNAVEALTAEARRRRLLEELISDPTSRLMRRGLPGGKFKTGKFPLR